MLMFGDIMYPAFCDNEHASLKISFKFRRVPFSSFASVIMQTLVNLFRNNSKNIYLYESLLQINFNHTIVMTTANFYVDYNAKLRYAYTSSRILINTKTAH